MRATRLLPLMAILLLPIPPKTSAQATKPIQRPARPAASTDAAAIRLWLDRWAKAFRAHDLDAITALYAPEVIAYDIVPPLRFDGRDAYRKDYGEFLAQYDGPIDVEYRDLHIITSGDLAYAACLERIGGKLKDGQRSDVWVRVTSVFQRRSGRWLDIHDHVSVPADFATGRAVLDLKP